MNSYSTITALSLVFLYLCILALSYYYRRKNGPAKGIISQLSNNKELIAILSDQYDHLFEVHYYLDHLGTRNVSLKIEGEGNGYLYWNTDTETVRLSYEWDESRYITHEWKVNTVHLELFTDKSDKLHRIRFRSKFWTKNMPDQVRIASFKGLDPGELLNIADELIKLQVCSITTKKELLE